MAMRFGSVMFITCTMDTPTADFHTNKGREGGRETFLR